MNDLVTDVKSLELETLKNLKSSKASNTLRAYKADYKDFARFCIKHGFKSMPTDPKVLSLATLLEHTDLILRTLEDSVPRMALNPSLQNQK